MKNLSRDEVRQIAALAKVELSEAESEKMLEDMNRMLQSFASLEEQAVPPELAGDARSALCDSTDHSPNHSDISVARRAELRDDVPLSFGALEALWSVFPESSERYLEVPETLAKSSS